MMVYLQMLDAGGDERSFTRLYDTYRGLMFYVARQILKNDEDAEDAVHEAFCAIAKNFSKISEINCPKTRSYVVIIVERKAIDILRKRSRLSQVAFEETTYGLPLPPPGDHGLADAMAALPAQYREVLLLRYEHGYAVREIAPMLGVKQDAVQKLLWRAKAALRKKLDEEDEAYGERRVF